VVLGQVSSLGARVELLRRGARRVLRVAAPLQTIESVLLGFLPGYSERFPNVHVELIEALGYEQFAAPPPSPRN
jgi:LysR family transcriptional regulator, nitrogen assimilation regulatory protein